MGPMAFAALRDVRHAARLLRRAPLFTVVAVLTLALAVGASTVIFTFVNAVLLRPLPLGKPDRLAMVYPDSGARLSSGYLDQWRRDGHAVADLAGWYDVRMNLTGSGQPREVAVDRVTSNFFQLLGVPPFLGRAFTPERDLRVVRAEIVLSAGLWRREFGSDPRLIGTSIVLDGATFTIVGVMPAGFHIRTNELAESRADAWIAFPLIGDNKVGMGGNLNVVARLADGATVDQARAELALIAQRLEAGHPSYSRRWHILAAPLADATVKEVRQTLLVLFGAVGILLLIACANVGTLMMSRAQGRRAEMAVRLSLGATTWRLVRQLLAESAILAAASGVLGAGLAVVGTRLLVLALPAGLDLPRVSEIHVDVRVLAFAVIVTGLTALLSGLVPAIVSARTAPAAALRAGARGVTGGPDGGRVHNVLVVAEVSLALILVSGAGLLGRSFIALSRVNPGFVPEHVVTLRTTLSADRYDNDARLRGFGTQLTERLAAASGLSASGFADYLPLGLAGEADFFEIEGRPPASPEERPGSWECVVGGSYFQAMGIPLRRGRLFDDSDTDRTAPVFVIDERLAQMYWPDKSPVDQRIRWNNAGATITGEIIGVVGSVHWTTLSADPMPTTYFWFAQRPRRALTIVARAPGDPGHAAGALTAAVHSVDSDQPVADVRTLDSFVSADLARPRFTALLLGGFAGAALLLAALGLYGVIAFSVAHRRREIGVRVALGAEPRDVVALMMTRGARLLAMGLAVGLAGALALGRNVAALLYGVSASDVETLSVVVLLLGGVGMLASYLPARQAARVDPIVVLKAD